METTQNDQPQIIELRPAGIFAFMRIFPLIFCTIGFLLLAWRFCPGLIGLSLISIAIALYRFIYIRNIKYLISPEVIRIKQGIFFKRVDQVELYRIKDYIIIRPFLLQLFRLMDLELKSTDPENPVIWLRGIPFSDLVDTIRNHVQEARQRNKIYEIN